jgi:hypothetical protein
MSEIQTTALSRWILAVAIVGAGLICLTVASHVRGAAAPVAQVHSSPIMTATVPPSTESAHAAVGPGITPPLSQALPIAKYRFGYLEFENDPDASTE